MLILDHVSKRYGSLIAVDDLSLAVEKGQVVGLLGMNGAGKSTTLNMITGCIAPSSGMISINGHDIIGDHREAKRSIGYLPETVPLYDEMTVEGYLRFVCKLKEIRKEYISSHINELCEMVGITSIRKRVIANLSKGLRQRVGIAQSLCGDPELIILDEPAIGLDPLQMIEFRKLIFSLSKSHTIIISSHILSEIQEVCNRIIILHHGKNVYDSFDSVNSETRTISVCAKISHEKFHSALAGILDVIRFEISETEDKMRTVAHITVNRTNDSIEEELFRALYKEKAPIYDMRPFDRDLEEIFVNLTGKG